MVHGSALRSWACSTLAQRLCICSELTFRRQHRFVSSKWHVQADGGQAEMTVHDDRSLLALQGPAAVETLQPLVDLDLSKVFFSNFHRLDIAGIPCYLTRTG